MWQGAVSAVGGGGSTPETLYDQTITVSNYTGNPQNLNIKSKNFAYWMVNGPYRSYGVFEEGVQKKIEDSYFGIDVLQDGSIGVWQTYQSPSYAFTNTQIFIWGIAD